MNLRKYLPFVALALVAIAADQALKLWTEANLPWQEPVELIPFFALFRTYNTGIAFSMLSWAGANGLLLVQGAVVLFVLYLAWRTTSRLALTGIALIIGGAFGNIIDRFAYGHVVDMFLFHTPVWSFAVFNLADAFITLGAALVLVHELFGAKDEPSKAD